MFNEIKKEGIKMMKEKILDVLKAMGFKLREVEGFAYEFYYEGNPYLYLPSENDEDFLNIAIPEITLINEDNINDVMIVEDKINSVVKYVKCYKQGDCMWMFYERELLGGEDLRQVVTRMIIHLNTAIGYYHQLLEHIKTARTKAERDQSSDDAED